MRTKIKSKSTRPLSFLESALKWGVFAIFAVLPLLYFPGRIASYVTSKQYFLIGIVELLTVLWIWLLVIDKRYRLTKKNLLLLLPLFLYTLSLTISAYNGVDPATSFFSTVETGTGLVVFYHIVLLVCIITSLIRVQQKELVRRIFQATFFASIVLAIATFFTGPNGLFDINSEMLNKSSGGAMMGNSLLVGAYGIFCFFFTFQLIKKEILLWKKIVYMAGLALIAFCPIYFNVALFKGKALSSGYLFIGEARIATVSLIVGLLISLFVYFALASKKTIKVIGGIGLGLIVIVGIMGFQQIISPQTNARAFFVEQSGNRITDWQEALKGIKERPLLGWGAENYHVVHQKYFNPIVFNPGHGNEGWALHPHNSTLEILVNGGCVAGFFYLVLLGVLFWGTYRLYCRNILDKQSFALMIGLYIAFILQQQMIYDSITSFTIFFSLFAIIAGLYDVNNDYKQVYPYVSSWLYSMATIISIGMIPLWIYASYLPARKMEEIYVLSMTASDQRASMYEHAFHSPGSYAISTDVEFFTDSLFFAYDAQKEQLKIDPLYQRVASAELSALIKAVDPILQHNPYDYHLALTMVQLENLEYYLTGNVTELANADRYAMQAFSLSVTDPDIYVSYAQTLVYENKIAEAKALLDKAIQINANYLPAVNFRKQLK